MGRLIGAAALLPRRETTQGTLIEAVEKRLMVFGAISWRSNDFRLHDGFRLIEKIERLARHAGQENGLPAPIRSQH